MARTGIPRLDSNQSCRGMDWTPMSVVLQKILLSPSSLVGAGLVTGEDGRQIGEQRVQRKKMRRDGRETLKKGIWGGRPVSIGKEADLALRRKARHASTRQQPDEREQLSPGKCKKPAQREGGRIEEREVEPGGQLWRPEVGGMRFGRLPWQLPFEIPYNHQKTTC